MVGVDRRPKICLGNEEGRKLYGARGHHGTGGGLFLSLYLGSHELDEDLTEEDRAWDPNLVQYQVLTEMPVEKVIARLRGAYIDMQVTDQWVGLRKTPDQDEKSKRMAYIYLPGERTALRIIAPDTYIDFFLLPSEPYAVLYGDRGDYDTTPHVYVYEPKDKAQ